MRLALLAFLCIPSMYTLGQTGPGGVGNSTTNVLWLDANSGVQRTGISVTGWNDRSGRNNHATAPSVAARSVYVASSVNGYPSIDLDGTDDQFHVPHHSSLNLTSWTMFIVVTADVHKDYNAWLAKGTDGQENYEMLSYADGNLHVPIYWTDNTRTHPSTPAGQVSNSTFEVFEYTYRSTGRRVYKNNTLVHTDAENKTPRTNSNPLYVGNELGTTGRFAHGDLAEVIVYNAPLNTVQRLVVNNYLAAKYGRSLASGDLYRQDVPAQGDFDHDIAGIGRANASNIQADSRGSGIVEIAGASNLGDNEYLFWGHNNGVLGTWMVFDRPVGVQGRWGRTWRVNEVNSSGTAVDVGSVTVTFDLTGLGSVTASDLRLLVDTDNDGTFADETPIDGAVSAGSDRYSFTGITALANDRRFTLGTINVDQTPLPVELLSFTATATTPHTVQVDWATATEQHSADFTVQRSTDLDGWSDVALLEAAGHSASLVTYQVMDHEAPAGTCYYRLLQRDTDGSFTFTHIIPVLVEGATQTGPLVYPNPSSGPLSVRWPAPADALVEYTLLDAQGRMLFSETHPATGDVVHHLNAGPPISGLYHLRLRAGKEEHVLGIQFVD